jgi:hypothetical protein
MPFDAKAWIAAHEPPTYIDRAGKTHTGRLWSHLQWKKWLDVLVEWDARRERKEPLSDEQYETELRQLLASMAFEPAVVDEMIALPSVALEQMVKGFFALQRAGRDEPPSTPALPAPSPKSPTTAPASEPSAS